MSGFLLSQQLRSALKREITNSFALREMLEQLSWNFATGNTVGDALDECLAQVVDATDVVDMPTAADLRDLAMARKFEQLEAV